MQNCYLTSQFRDENILQPPFFVRVELDHPSSSSFVAPPPPLIVINDWLL